MMSFWGNLPVKWKLTAIFLLLALILITATFLGMRQTYRKGFMLKNQQAGEKIVRLVAETIAAGTVIDDSSAREITRISGQEFAIFREDVLVASSSPSFAKVSKDFLLNSHEELDENASMIPHIDVGGVKRALLADLLTDSANNLIGTIVVGVDETGLNSIQQRSENTMIRFVSILVVATILLVYWGSSMIVRPLNRVSRAAGRIADGEITSELPTVRGRDEIATLTRAFQSVVAYFREMAQIATHISNGELEHSVTPRSEHDILGHAFQHMLDYLKQMTSVVMAVADGDLRQELHAETELDVLGKAFQQLHSLREFIREIVNGTERLGDAAAVLKQISADMASGAEQVSEQAHIVSGNNQQINQNMNGVSTATEELASSIREISQMTHEVSAIANSAIELTNSASMAIFALKSDSDEIGDIVKMINNIAQQTNLLALNATIEAARAGDMGKGFAVVASEVKDLSRETTSSLEDITHKVDAIRTSSKEVTDAVVQLSDIIHRIHELSTSIAAAIEQQAATTNEISRNISDTAHGSDEINTTMTEVASATRQVSIQTSDVQEAAEELADLADQLHQLVKKFKV